MCFVFPIKFCVVFCFSSFYFISCYLLCFILLIYLFIFIFDFLLGLRPKPIEPSNALWAFSYLAQTRSTGNGPRLKHPNDGPSPRLAFLLQLVRALPLIRSHAPTPSRATTWFSFCFMQSLRYLSTSRSASRIPHRLLPSHLHFFFVFFFSLPFLMNVGPHASFHDGLPVHVHFFFACFFHVTSPYQLLLTHDLLSSTWCFLLTASSPCLLTN